jgi:hypothetical protein
MTKEEEIEQGIKLVQAALQILCDESIKRIQEIRLEAAVHGNMYGTRVGCA